MADINNPITYVVPVRSMIQNKLNDPNFTHTNWGDQDLAEFRKLVRDHYRNEQKGICAFCKGELSLTSAQNCHVEHLVSKSRRREFIFEPRNLCVICAECNEAKRAKDIENAELDPLKRGGSVKSYPRSAGAFLIVHPHFDVWDDHIIAFGRLFVDLTDKGHFTIGACVLNRRLRKFGWEAVVTDDVALRQAAAAWLGATDSLNSGRALNVMKRLLALA